MSGYRVPDRYYESQLKRLLGDRPTPEVPHPELFRKIADDFWLWLHTEGVKGSSDLRQMLPGMPEERVQLQANGLSGDRALEDGFLVYRLFTRIYQGLAGDLSTCRAILDFGCGWGRVTRFFLRDIQADRVWGVDHYDKAVDVCRQTNRWQKFIHIKPLPQIDFLDSTFDLIFAYSVFSHLSEPAQR